jgi:P-type Cu+ transporter
MQKTRLTLDGMHCAGCANTIEKALKTVPGVDAVNVNFATREATVSYEDARDTVPLLVKAVENAGYQAKPVESGTHGVTTVSVQTDREIMDLQRRVFMSWLLSAPVVTLTMFGIHLPAENWIYLFLTTPVLFWAGSPFFVEALKALRHRQTNMSTLVALGTGSAYLYSLAVTLLPGAFQQMGIEPHAYYEIAAALITFLLLGRMFEARARGHISVAITRLLSLQPQTAWAVRETGEEEIPLDAIVVGDQIRVRPGERVPVDGMITEGDGELDEAILTGESLPVAKGVGEKVIGASLNKSGSFIYTATQVGEDTVLHQIIRLVREAQGGKAPIQRLADKVSGVFVPTVLVIAFITFAVWIMVGPEPRLGFALIAFVSVLIIACPCALGLATPTAIMVGTGTGAEHGILIRNGESLERAEQLNTIILDKTGTLTQGEPQLTRIMEASLHDNPTPETLLRWAASVELASEHSLGQAIVRKAETENLDLLPANEFKSLPGHGVSAQVAGKTIVLGNLGLMQDCAVEMNGLEATAHTLAESGETPVFIAVDGKAAGVFGIADTLKPHAREAVESLKQLGLEVLMVTGDHPAAARAIAEQVGIDQVMAEVLPAGKAEIVRKLQAEGKVVAMVGDGINDAPALTQADIGIALGAGTDVAIESATFTLIRNDLRDVAQALRLSRRTMSIIRQNLFFAFFYNILGIPVAAGVLYPFLGVLLNPMVAGAAMAFSSVSVVMNSLRLQRLD